MCWPAWTRRRHACHSTFRDVRRRILLNTGASWSSVNSTILRRCTKRGTLRAATSPSNTGCSRSASQRSSPRRYTRQICADQLQPGCQKWKEKCRPLQIPPVLWVKLLVLPLTDPTHFKHDFRRRCQWLQTGQFHALEHRMH